MRARFSVGRDMDVRKVSGLNLGAARKLHAASKEEVKRRKADSAAWAAQQAAAEQAAHEAEMSRVADGLQDAELVQLLSSNAMLVEARGSL